MLVRKTPHTPAKQKKLHRAITEWLVIDSLPFNIVHGKGYRKMMNRIDPALASLSNKGVKTEIETAYNIGVKMLKNLIANTCETASLMTDLWTSRN